jgi:hypothetical protein
MAWASRVAARLGLVRALARLGHEDHVDVADVVELPGAALAHPHDREPYLAVRRTLVDLGARDGQRGLQGRAREVGQLGGDLGQRGLSGQVAGGHVRQPPPVGDPQGDQRVRGGGARLGRVGFGADRAQQRRPVLGQRGHGQQVEVLGMAFEVVAEGGAHAEQGEHPLPEPLVGAQPVEGGGLPLGQPGQRGQCQGRIGHRDQRFEQAVEVDPRPLDQPGGAGRVGESESGEAGCGGLDPGHPSILTVPGVVPGAGGRRIPSQAAPLRAVSRITSAKASAIGRQVASNAPAAARTPSLSS